MACGPAGMDRAARLGDGWLGGPGTTLDGARAECDRYRERCAAHGRTPSAVALRRDVYVGATEADAEAVRQGPWPPVTAASHRRRWSPAPSTRSSSSLAAFAALGVTDVLVRHLTNEQSLVLPSLERLARCAASSRTSDDDNRQLRTCGASAAHGLAAITFSRATAREPDGDGVRGRSPRQRLSRTYLAADGSVCIRSRSRTDRREVTDALFDGHRRRRRRDRGQRVRQGGRRAGPAGDGLERQTAYRDKVRGEFMHPWGVAEARRLGVEDVLVGTGGTWITEGIGYDELLPPAAAEQHPLNVAASGPTCPAPWTSATPRRARLWPPPRRRPAARSSAASATWS